MNFLPFLDLWNYCVTGHKVVDVSVYAEKCSDSNGSILLELSRLMYPQSLHQESLMREHRHCAWRNPSIELCCRSVTKRWKWVETPVGRNLCCSVYSRGGRSLLGALRRASPHIQSRCLSSKRKLWLANCIWSVFQNWFFSFTVLSPLTSNYFHIIFSSQNNFILMKWQCIIKNKHLALSIYKYILKKIQKTLQNNVALILKCNHKFFVKRRRNNK